MDNVIQPTNPYPVDGIKNNRADKMLKHTGDEETDLCAMLNKISTVRYKYIGNI